MAFLKDTSSSLICIAVLFIYFISYSYAQGRVINNDSRDATTFKERVVVDSEDSKDLVTTVLGIYEGLSGLNMEKLDIREFITSKYYNTQDEELNYEPVRYVPPVYVVIKDEALKCIGKLEAVVTMLYKFSDKGHDCDISPQYLIMKNKALKSLGKLKTVVAMFYQLFKKEYDRNGPTYHLAMKNEVMKSLKRLKAVVAIFYRSSRTEYGDNVPPLPSIMKNQGLACIEELEMLFATLYNLSEKWQGHTSISTLEDNCPVWKNVEEMFSTLSPENWKRKNRFEVSVESYKIINDNIAFIEEYLRRGKLPQNKLYEWNLNKICLEKMKRLVLEDLPTYIADLGSKDLH